MSIQIFEGQGLNQNKVYKNDLLVESESTCYQIHHVYIKEFTEPVAFVITYYKEKRAEYVFNNALAFSHQEVEEIYKFGIQEMKDERYKDTDLSIPGAQKEVK